MKNVFIVKRIFGESEVYSKWIHLNLVKKTSNVFTLLRTKKDLHYLQLHFNPNMNLYFLFIF